uniref:Uncharacterized protein n=1 Tax=Marseillevirus LCMAC101 TaxID=2506602 RepID=A0A481YRX1_9VIRU|nr:MAG: hypothetical protein LCMAC101_05560 [Marseillevirus LCMAC101]
MLAIDECRDDFVPYAIIFAFLHIMFFLSLMLLAAKVLLYDVRCSSCPFISVSLLLGVSIIGYGIFIFVVNGISYGIGFDNVCQTINTLCAIFNSIVYALMVLGVFYVCTLDKKEEETNLVVNV